MEFCIIIYEISLHFNIFKSSFIQNRHKSTIVEENIILMRSTSVSHGITLVSGIAKATGMNNHQIQQTLRELQNKPIYLRKIPFLYKIFVFHFHKISNHYLKLTCSWGKYIFASYKVTWSFYCKFCASLIYS